jgi:hypothetical protein
MKRIILLAVSTIVVYMAMGQQGKYAGSMKKLIGQTYTDSKMIPALSTWTLRQGSIASPLSDPEWFMVEVYQKGSSYIVFFSVVEDTSVNKSQILDVIEITGVKPGAEIKTGVCREYKTENGFIVALVRPIKAEYTPVKKAWSFNRDKRRFELLAVANVDCLNEGFDLD